VANRSGDHSRLTTGARPWDFSSHQGVPCKRGQSRLAQKGGGASSGRIAHRPAVQSETIDQVASLFTGKHLASGFESWRCGLVR
jgi:hypothetical protein